MRSTGSRIWGYEWQSAASRVRFSRGVLGVDGRAAAYGATATARGTISPMARPVRYQLAGQLTNADLRRMPRQLPLPRLDSDLAGSYNVTGAGTRIDASMVFDPSTVEGTGIGRGSRGRFSNVDEVIRYGFDGRVDHANVEHWGQVLEIESLQRDVYASDLSGQLTVDGSGTSLATLVLDAKASLESSTAFNASFERADVTAQIENQTLTTSARGTASNVNATVLAGMTTLDSGLTGAFDVMGTVAHLDQPFTLDAVDASGSLDFQESFVGPVEITKGRVVARVANSQADVTSFEALGPQMDVTASGAVALAERGESNLKYTVTMGDLSRVSPLVGRTLAGRAQAEGTLAGTFTDPTVAATLKASSVKVDDIFQALTIEGNFDGSIPGRDVNAFTGTLKTNSTLVTVAGRNVPQLMVALQRAGDDVQFQAEAREAGRAVSGEGQVMLFSDYRDVRVNRLAIEAGHGAMGPARRRADAGALRRQRPGDVFERVHAGQRHAERGGPGHRVAQQGSRGPVDGPGHRLGPGRHRQPAADQSPARRHGGHRGGDWRHIRGAHDRRHSSPLPTAWWANTASIRCKPRWTTPRAAQPWTRG